MIHAAEEPAVVRNLPQISSDASTLPTIPSGGENRGRVQLPSRANKASLPSQALAAEVPGLNIAESRFEHTTKARDALI